MSDPYKVQGTAEYAAADERAKVIFMRLRQPTLRNEHEASVAWRGRRTNRAYYRRMAVAELKREAQP